MWSILQVGLQFTWYTLQLSYNFDLFRQKLRKYIKNEFEDDVAKFRENPDDDDDVEDAVPQEEKGDDDEDSDDESPDKSDFSKADMFKKGMFFSFLQIYMAPLYFTYNCI